MKVCRLCGQVGELGYEFENGLAICADCTEDIAISFTEKILGLDCTTLDYCDFVLLAYYGYEAIKTLSPASKQKLFWVYQSKTSARES